MFDRPHKMPLPSWSKSHSHFVAFFLMAKLLTEAIAAKATSRSRNNVQKFEIPKNKPKKLELANPSTTPSYTVAISSIHSRVLSESKQEVSIQSNVTNTSTAATTTIYTPESSIDFDSRKRPVSSNVNLKIVKVINWNQNKWNFHLTLLRSESYFSLFLLCI